MEGFIGGYIMLELALKATLPLIHVRTDDILNVEEVLSFIAGEQVYPVNVPETIPQVSGLKVPAGRILYTSSKCDSLAKLYAYCVDNDKCIVFVNTEKSVLQFDGGTLFPPKELVAKFLGDFVPEDEVELLLPCFGGLTLKDVGEISKMVMTRDQSLTPRGVNEMRRAYMGNLRGIQQVDTDLPYYLCPSYLSEWMNKNRGFFLHPVHQALIPRGLLFDGVPGTGKTLASKFIASAFGVPLYRLDLGAMMGKYVGESEHNLTSALAQIDQVEPCVVIFDEVEKIFQNSSDHGVTSRLLSQLLWWLQEHKTKVFSVMTTNNVKVIPDELYREGRIDATMLFLGIETKTEAIEFAAGAAQAMAKATGLTLDKAAYAKMEKKVGALYIDKQAVPQATITQLVNDLIKDVYLQGGSYE